MDIALKKNEANIKKPLAAPEIGKKPERVHRIRLSNYQVIGGIIGILALLVLVRWSQQPQFYAEDVRLKTFQRFCRVTFTAKNPRSQSINAQALIVFYSSIDTSDGYYYFPTGTVKIPLSLAGNETRTVTEDVVHSETTSRCQKVEVNALGLTNWK